MKCLAILGMLLLLTSNQLRAKNPYYKCLSLHTFCTLNNQINFIIQGHDNTGRKIILFESQANSVEKTRNMRDTLSRKYNIQGAKDFSCKDHIVYCQ